MCDHCKEYHEQLVLLQAVIKADTTDIAHEEATTLSYPERVKREAVKKEAKKHMEEFRNYFNCQKAGARHK